MAQKLMDPTDPDPEHWLKDKSVLVCAVGYCCRIPVFCRLSVVTACKCYVSLILDGGVQRKVL
jgi:hypothetical protein